MTRFIAEISSNHNGDKKRCQELIRAAADCGCWGVKFQLFRIEQLFSSEILQVSEFHRLRRRWELPLHFLPDLAKCARDNGLAFGCTPFDLEAVQLLRPHVDFLKVASYELPWLDLIRQCSETGLPLMFSCGMAHEMEIRQAVEAARAGGCQDLTVFHCISNYPVAKENCQLAAIGSLKNLLDHDFPQAKVGWSDHSVDAGVIFRAINKWDCEAVEFHFDLDGQGKEFGAGHCWLPEGITPLINGKKFESDAISDGIATLAPSAIQLAERPWRADPTDGLRPTREIRKTWPLSQDSNHNHLLIAFLAGGPGLGHLVRLLAIAESLREDHRANCLFYIHESPGAIRMLARHGFAWLPRTTADSHLNKLKFSGWVFDQKEPCSELVAKLNAVKIPVIAIDRPDCTNADLVVVPCFGPCPAPHYGGPEYLLLRQDILRLKAPHPPSPGPNIVVSFGAEDPNLLTEKIATALAQIPDQVPVNFVIGPDFSQHRADWPSAVFSPENFHLIETNDPLETILPGAGLLITALGVTLAEAHIQGVPVAVLTNYESDRQEMETLVNSHSVANLGFHADLSNDNLATLLSQLWDNPQHRQELAIAGLQQTDGLGAKRTADLIAPLLKEHPC